MYIRVCFLTFFVLFSINVMADEGNCPDLAGMYGWCKCKGIKNMADGNDGGFTIQMSGAAPFTYQFASNSGNDSDRESGKNIWLYPFTPNGEEQIQDFSVSILDSEIKGKHYITATCDKQILSLSVQDYFLKEERSSSEDRRDRSRSKPVYSKYQTFLMEFSIDSKARFVFREEHVVKNQKNEELQFIRECTCGKKPD